MDWGDARVMLSVKAVIQERFDRMNKPSLIMPGWENNLPKIDLSNGVLAYLMNDFYVANRWAFPYDSIRRAIDALYFPGRPAHVTDFPDEAQTAWSEELQGVACDGKNWYITQVYKPDENSRVWKFPISYNLADVAEGPLPPGVKKAGIPKQLRDKGYWHFGDLDYYAGRLYVPCQGGDPAQVVVFDAEDLSFLGAAGLEGGTGAWCAINPKNGLLHESDFYDIPEMPFPATPEDVSKFEYDVQNPPPLRLRIYNPIWNAGKIKEFDPVGELELSDRRGGRTSAYRIQGGAFSENGRLYLISDDTRNGKARLLGFEMMTGRQMFGKSIEYSPDYPDLEEFEAIAIYDLDGNQSPGISGQLHVILLDNDIHSDDDIIFKHFRVGHKERL